MQINIDPIIEKTKIAISNHELPQRGYYKRYADGNSGANEYGCADAANLLYTINAMPTDRTEKEAMVEALRSFQDKETGLFREPSHHPYHCTAHCLAALELFDAEPLYRVSEADRYENPASVRPFLASLGWDESAAGHLGAGMFSIMFLTKRMSLDWQNEFFGYLDENIDMRYGVSMKGAVATGKKLRWQYMGDWFHLMFCYHACHRAFPCTEQLIDYCIEDYENNIFPESFGKGQRFLDIDWTFAIYRAAVQSGYRLDKVKALLRDFAKKLTDYLANSPLDEPQWKDMHLMFGSICGLAELQIALPGELLSTRPLRQVMDRRPFI